MSVIKGITPCGNRLLVELVPAETVTPQGIILPSANKAKQNKAIVIALGNGPKQLKDGSWLSWPVQEGDMVLLAKYAGVEVGEDHLIVSSDDVIAVIR